MKNTNLAQISVLSEIINHQNLHASLIYDCACIDGIANISRSLAKEKIYLPHSVIISRSKIALALVIQQEKKNKTYVNNVGPPPNIT